MQAALAFSTVTRGTAIPLGLLRGPEELHGLVGGLGQPAYRGGQVHRWVFGRGVGDPRAMTDLPRGLRERLVEAAWASRAVVQELQPSADGTVKALLRLLGPRRAPADVEAVLIPHGQRLTLCLSSQAGCAVGCPFCATGLMGLVRQLDPGEIAGQFLWARAVAGRWPTHAVFMGMGEPLANYEAVRAAIDLIRPPAGFGLGARRLTLSTAGLVPGIRRLSTEAGLQVGLAISLHAADDELRSRLVPLNRAYPLAELMQACREYVQATRRRISFEYVLLRGVNDRPHHARALRELLSGLLGHVNLIPYNPVPGLPFHPPARDEVLRFQAALEALGIAATVRWSRGADIQAACGQLRAGLESAGKAGGGGRP